MHYGPRRFTTLAGAALAPAAGAEDHEFKILPRARNADQEVTDACLRVIRERYGSGVARTHARIMRPEGWPAWIRVEATLKDGRACICHGFSDYPYGITIYDGCE